MTIRFLPGVTLGRPSDPISPGNERRLVWLQNSAFQRGCFYFYKARKDLLYFIALLTTLQFHDHSSFLHLCWRHRQYHCGIDILWIILGVLYVSAQPKLVLHGKESALKGFENILLGLLYE